MTPAGTSLTSMLPVLIVVCGAAIGSSLTYLLVSTPLFRKVSLDERLGPYLRSTEEATRRYHLNAPTRSGFVGMCEEWLQKASVWASSRLTTDASVIRRLERLGPGARLETFRAHQLIFIAIGISLGALAATGISLLRGFNPVAVPTLIVLGGICGHFLNDWLLSNRVKKRETAILAEFPTIAEILALSITAGEGTVDALERVQKTTTGELSAELDIALAQARTGTSLVEALDTMARRIGLQSLIQFVDVIAVATARGTPLSEVLRAQASDVREEGRRVLMELSGKKEVGMLVPVVLFVLPITVLFAVYPSLTVLEIGL